LKDISFRVGPHDFVCIVGPSGCGKTTLLKLIAGLLEPTSGYISFEQETSNGRLRTALVFQEHGIFPWMTVLDNVAFGLEMQGRRRRECLERAKSFLNRIGLQAFLHSYPHELSVGMKQRIDIARAFVADPAFLLLDEPFGSLDAQTKLVLQEELMKFWREQPKSVVYVTHDIQEAILLGDRVLVMSGRPASILEEIPVPLPRPRDMLSSDEKTVKSIQWHIWNLIKTEVRKSLSLAE